MNTHTHTTARESLPAISGGILAGGEGRRFGGLDKGWVEHRGHAFVEHVLLRLQPQVDDIVISANRHLPRYAALGHPVVQDRVGAGPLAGLLRLLESARHEWLLTVPCDAIRLPPDTARRLLDTQEQTGADIVVLRDADAVHPTISLARTRLAVDLEAFLQEGGRAMQAWQQRHARAFALLDEPLVNVNDAATLRALEPAHG
jgi:molybdopterin-guanine dinucleotide biosynthesis protein A